MTETLAVRSLNHRQFWVDFFLLYKSLPALWNVSSTEYKDRYAKIRAYDLMAKKLSELKPNASRADVLRRINIFRTNYRRERGRIQQQQAQSKNFRASLWYYNYLTFLDTQEPRSKRKSLLPKKNLDETDIGDENQYVSEKYIAYDDMEDNVDTSHSNVEFKMQETTDIINEDIYDINDDTSATDGIRNGTENFGYFIEGYGDELTSTENIQYTNSSSNENASIVCENVDNLLHNYSEECEQQFENEDYEHNIGDLEEEDTGGMYSVIEQQENSNEYMFSEEEMLPDLNCDKNMMLLGTHEEDNAVDDNIIENKTRENLSLLKRDRLNHGTAVSNNQTQVAFAQTMTDESNVITQIACQHQLSSAGEILARSWALQYDEMPAQQKVFARKAIGDILFAGCMGKLGELPRNSRPSSTTSEGNKTTRQAISLDNGYYVSQNGHEVKIEDWQKFKMKQKM